MRVCDRVFSKISITCPSEQDAPKLECGSAGLEACSKSLGQHLCAICAHSMVECGAWQANETRLPMMNDGNMIRDGSESHVRREQGLSSSEPRDEWGHSLGLGIIHMGCSEEVKRIFDEHQRFEISGSRVDLWEPGEPEEPQAEWMVSSYSSSPGCPAKSQK